MSLRSKLDKFLFVGSTPPDGFKIYPSIFWLDVVRKVSENFCERLPFVLLDKNGL